MTSPCEAKAQGGTGQGWALNSHHEAEPVLDSAGNQGQRFWLCLPPTESLLLSWQLCIQRHVMREECHYSHETHSQAQGEIGLETKPGRGIWTQGSKAPGPTNAPVLRPHSLNLTVPWLLRTLWLLGKMPCRRLDLDMSRRGAPRPPKRPKIPTHQLSCDSREPGGNNHLDRQPCFKATS